MVLLSELERSCLKIPSSLTPEILSSVVSSFRSSISLFLRFFFKGVAI